MDRPSGTSPPSYERLHRPAVDGAIRVDTEEELLRKRQCVLVMVLGLVFPALVAWWMAKGEAEPSHILTGLAPLALSGWAAKRYFTPVYVLLRQGAETVIFRRSTRSTQDAVSRVVLGAGDLCALELVWFPLEYPDFTLIEFHVRGEGHPWLVLFASKDEERTHRKMQSLSQRLLLSAHDRTSEGPAGDVPRQYLLTPEEKKAQPAGVHSGFALIFGSFGAAFYWAGFVPVAVVFFVLAALFFAGRFWKRSPEAVPDKYRRWLRS